MRWSKITTKENVLQVVNSFTYSFKPEEDPFGIDTSTIAKKINKHRTDTSKALNSLTRNNILFKIAGRPVHYLSKSAFEHRFNVRIKKDVYKPEELEGLINNNNEVISEDEEITVLEKTFGFSGEMKTIIKQAKAVIDYPPNGLNAIITGPTGSGKTLLAETIYKYGVETKKIDPKSPFVRFNCADYASNPQLLLSQLFGHEAGAYTGAKEKKKGLVELANNGILFLDEVHSLPIRGQEMLFTLLDKGTYRSLGQTTSEQKVNLLLIMATNHEQLSEVIIPTLMRRIPVVIKMPPLINRQPQYRLEIIKQFFEEEAKNMKRTIFISKDAIEALLFCDFPGNIGQLKSDIKNICSKLFVENRNKQIIKISLSDLPEHIIGNIVFYTNSLSDISQILKGDMVISPGTISKTLSYFSLVSMLISEFDNKSENVSFYELDHLVQIYLNQYVHSFSNHIFSDKVIYKYVKDFLRDVPLDEESLRIAELGLYHFILDLQKGHILPIHIFEKIKSIVEEKYPNLYALNKSESAFMLNKYPFLNEEIVTFVCSYLVYHLTKSKNRNKKIYFLSENYSDNNRISAAINRLLSLESDQVTALNCEKIFNNIKEDNRESKSVIVITPEYAKKILKQTIKEKTGIDSTILIDYISTSKGITLVNKLIQCNWDLTSFEKESGSQDITKSIATFFKPLSLVITTCDNEEFSAKNLCRTIENVLKVKESHNYDAHIIGYNQMKTPEIVNETIEKIKHEQRLIYIVDMLNIDYSVLETQIIPLETFLDPIKMMKITNNILKKSENPESEINNTTYNNGQSSFSRYISFIDIAKLETLIQQFFTMMENDYQKELSFDEQKRMLLYSAFMLERIITQKTLQVSIPFSNKNENKMDIISKLCYIFEEAFFIEIPSTEREWLNQMVFNRKMYS